MKRSDKKDLVQRLKDELDSSTSVIVTHYSGLTVNESEELRSEMRVNGAKFKVTKCRGDSSFSKSIEDPEVPNEPKEEK